MNHKDSGLVPESVFHLCKEYGVQELSVFGSASGENFTSESDLDLLVEFKPYVHIGLMDFAALQRRLSELVGRPVDLVSKRGLNPLIRDEVLAQAKVLYAGG
jgi:predicted nucleotidyltransferase